ncbi:MAG: molybdenum cofactor guanylyltransferase, partial [Candidatus Nanopelagicales bacterium]
MGSLAAIVIAGGEGRRFGADKLALRDAQGMGLLEATIASLGEVAEPIIVVGPERPVARDVIWAREDPPGGGPCAALIAGVAHVPEGVTHVAVLAGDAPTGGRAIPALRQVIDDAAAAVVTDSSGR